MKRRLFFKLAGSAAVSPAVLAGIEATTEAPPEDVYKSGFQMQQLNGTYSTAIFGTVVVTGNWGGIPY